MTRTRTTDFGETEYGSTTPRLITSDRVWSDMSDDISMADRCAFCRRPEEDHPVYDGKGGSVCMMWMDTIPWT